MQKGFPYESGYLLYGEPSSGETSKIKAIAHQLSEDDDTVKMPHEPIIK